MAYFSQLPNIYVGEGITDDEGFKYRLVKNLFRRTVTRIDLDKYITLLEPYSIGDHETAALLAGEMYGDIYLDWIILLVNNITDVYEEWPKNVNELQTYVANKYDKPDDIHHYETNEILYNEEIFIQKGTQVNNTFRAILPDGTTKTENESIYPVTNYEYEDYQNELKRNIKLPTPPIMELIQNEFEELIAYEPNDEIDREGNKKTLLNSSARFLDKSGNAAGSVTVTDNVGTVTSYDNGPGSTTTTVT